MSSLFRRRSKKGKRDLIDVESMLQSGLQPVSPRPEFIQNLQKGLMNYSYPEVEETQQDIRRPLVFALIGVIGLFFLFSLWIRLMLVILSALGMMQSSRTRKLAE
ncbi:MAG: hypothetical protein C3F13_07980 [Anaerolineales bacterium]|nr:hypothetical protein [Anaerolineae bacterium]PWB53835.1 MAG: hypothetical protein C3F13_07980 [Anaerolineales bacterium]